MIDDTEDQPYDPASGDLHPELAQVIDQAGDAQDWARDAASEVQDHFTTQAILDSGDQAAEQTATDLAQTKNNLVGMARRDPSSADLAIKLADGLGDQLGADDLAGHMKSEIARSAVQGMAERDPEVARQLLDKYDEHLTDDDTAGLSTYIDNMDMVRQVDRAASYTQARQAMAQQNEKNALGWLGHLVDPDTGAIQYKPGWGQAMMADQQMSPDTKGGLFAAYHSLLKNGDPPASDPQVLGSLLDRAARSPRDPDHPSIDEVLTHVGQGLTMEDARFLSERLGPQSPAQRDELDNLATAMATAREQIGNKNAQGRFMNWFFPAYQRLTSTGIEGRDLLNPGSKTYMLNPETMAQFKPNGNDMIVPAVRPTADARRSLDEIFSRDEEFSSARYGVGDPVIRNLRTGNPNLMPDPGSARPVGDPVIRSQRAPHGVNNPRESFSGADAPRNVPRDM